MELKNPVITLRILLLFGYTYNCQMLRVNKAEILLTTFFLSRSSNRKEKDALPEIALQPGKYSDWESSQLW